MALPVLWQGRLLAVFAAQSTQNHLGKPALAMLDTLVEQLAPSLENALLYAQVVELSDIKTRMIRMASHDLKNPLSNIIGYGHLVLNHDDNLSASSRKFVENMVRAGGHMNQIITDILNLDQLRSGEIKRESLRMDELLDEVLQHHTLDMQSKGQSLKTTIDEATPGILGDRRKLTQAFTNLIGNAVKYTPDGGNVTVRLFKHGDTAHVEVQDTGYGIPEAAQPKLFQEFYRVQTQATAHISGTGLGLTLVKSVIEAHQGRIWFKSVEGVGSTFFVELPLAEVKNPVES
jgi:signal transduction histidine kinase